MTKPAEKTHHCHVCGKEFPDRKVRSWGMVRPGVSDRINADHPGWDAGKFICLRDLAVARRHYVEALLEEERGDLGRLERQVLDALSDQQLLARNPTDEAEEAMTLGDRISDQVAAFGGSWTFIISFVLVLAGWMGINLIGVMSDPFDPYPFILLNLVLSTIAALQAPVIMMSQRRQEKKDRLRAENDYQVNLKAELEIRQISEKIDHQLAHQWGKLTELQKIQIDLLEEQTMGRGSERD